MTSYKPIYTVVLAAVLTATLSACADFRPGASQNGTANADSNITTDVQARLDEMTNLGPPGAITVQTLDHVVYLNGVVDVGLEKRLAESVARQAAGVTSVVNNIAVSHS